MRELAVCRRRQFDRALLRLDRTLQIGLVADKCVAVKQRVAEVSLPDGNAIGVRVGIGLGVGVQHPDRRVDVPPVVGPNVSSAQDGSEDPKAGVVQDRTARESLRAACHTYAFFEVVEGPAQVVAHR